MGEKVKSDDRWLEKWYPTIQGKAVLELGCGKGRDTSKLARVAGELVAADISPALGLGDLARVLQLDHSRRLPFPGCTFDVVIASLTLHYFDWKTTGKVFSEIARVLGDGGNLICRLNSNRDIHHGAVGHPELEPGLYSVNGQLKRFFTKSDIEALMVEPWRLLELHHRKIDRYEKAKLAWEFCAEKSW
nr:class I SAM-dependent methyltransferase [Microbulbifer zhoushanensis]